MRRSGPRSGSRYSPATTTYAGFTEPSSALSTSASITRARVDVPSGGSSARSADDTTTSAIAVVNASWRSTTRSGTPPPAPTPPRHNAHFERGDRAMAMATSATYMARTTKRATISIPSVSTPRLRVTNTDAACGRYGTGDGNVEKVTKPSLGSPGHGVMGPGVVDDGLAGARVDDALQVVLGEHLRVGALRADDVAGMHAPPKLSDPSFSGKIVPVEIWYER